MQFRFLPNPAALLLALSLSAAAQTAKGGEAASSVPLEAPSPSPALLQDVPATPPDPQTPARSVPLRAINQTVADQSDNQLNPAVFLHHLIADRFWISGQANFIFQAHEPFHAPYSGPNSFRSYGETALSRVLTLYTGVRFAPWSEFLLDAEETGGDGLSTALGLAGFTNLDVVRNPSLGQGVYLSRYMLHQTIPLTKERVETEPDPFSLRTSVPTRRLDFRMGKMGLVDFFDVNAVGSDSHLQFTNWAIDNNGAYDYAADTRGYTIASILEYQSPRLGVRFGEALMPTVANGITLDYAMRRARAENLEFEWRPVLSRKYATSIRPLAYLNHANMGDYREAINAYRSGANATPDITLHRHQGTLKQGFGLNLEQDLPANVRLYLRTGWNEGHHESFAYTEINSTLSLGGDIDGANWGRRYDRIGTAVVTNGLSRDHRDYLALGGLGFLLGDGRLRYGREFISESYYTVHAVSGLYFSAQLSFVDNPGYNRDRGPVVVPGLRAHIDF